MRYQFAFFVLLCMPQYVHAQDTTVFYPTKDTYINTVIPDLYQGVTQSFIAAGWTYGGQPGQGRSLMGFEVCDRGPNFQLVEAKLYLYYDTSASHAGHTIGDNTAKLYQITSFWDENTTWSTQPSYDPMLSVSLPAASTATQNYVVDVTSLVAASLTVSNRVEFYFKLDNEAYYRSLVFSSSDHPDSLLHPQLELIYVDTAIWCNTGVGIPGGGSGSGSGSGTAEIPVDSFSMCFNEAFVPNVFTPNKDQKNDLFTIEFDCPVANYQAEIFNRYGDVVYTTNAVGKPWDGTTKNGKPASEGTYFYIIKARQNNIEFVKKGTVTLLR